MDKKFAVVGFPKCGTMSLAEYLKKKHPGAEVTRPENIYIDLRGLHVQEKWHEWKCCVITRGPAARIKSGIRYFTELRTLPINEILKGTYNGAIRYQNVGFRNPVQQSDYEYYIKKFERRHGVQITRYRFEDLVQDEDFPHANKTEFDKDFSESDDKLIRDTLKDAGIKY